MTELEALLKYCGDVDFEAFDLSDEDIERYYEYERRSLGFQRFQLYIAVQELKQSIKDAIIETFLTIKGRII